MAPTSSPDIGWASPPSAHRQLCLRLGALLAHGAGPLAEGAQHRCQPRVAGRARRRALDAVGGRLSGPEQRLGDVVVLPQVPDPVTSQQQRRIGPPVVGGQRVEVERHNLGLRGDAKGVRVKVAERARHRDALLAARDARRHRARRPPAAKAVEPGTLGSVCEVLGGLARLARLAVGWG
eukprot:scaffold11238_cov114-Isochrysis_galbana.AAC.1